MTNKMLLIIVVAIATLVVAPAASADRREHSYHYHHGGHERHYRRHHRERCSSDIRIAYTKFERITFRVLKCWSPYRGHTTRRFILDREPLRHPYHGYERYPYYADPWPFPPSR